jgi:hypothetical protein
LGLLKQSFEGVFIAEQLMDKEELMVVRVELP